MTASSTDEALDQPPATFESLGLIQPLITALRQLNFTAPTQIQEQAIPFALQGRDIIGVAETGSGKTAAFGLPILQKLWDDPKPLFACMIAPTRELAQQISKQIESLGSDMGVRCVLLIGGMDMMEQSVALAKKPHVVVATPGRLLKHLNSTKGFSLRNLKFLVLDEADRLLDLDHGPDIDSILRHLPKERNTYLFSATMSTKVAKLQRASLRDPVRVEVSKKYATATGLVEYYLFIPLMHKDVNLVYVLNELSHQSIIVFTRTVHESQRLSYLLRSLGFSAIPFNGQLSQSARLGALNKFRAGGRSILVATDVAGRGLDIPRVDVVINFDMPQHSKDYVHRVGRTARAGRTGKSITFVTQYDVEACKRVEEVTGKEMIAYPVDQGAAMLLKERVGEAQRMAVRELKDMAASKGNGAGGRKRKMESSGEARDRDDDQHEAGMPQVKKYRGRK